MQFVLSACPTTIGETLCVELNCVYRFKVKQLSEFISAEKVCK